MPFRASVHGLSCWQLLRALAEVARLSEAIRAASAGRAGRLVVAGIGKSRLLGHARELHNAAVPLGIDGAAAFMVVFIPPFFRETAPARLAVMTRPDRETAQA